MAPAELEALLLANDEVADAAVIGVRDEEAGGLPKGFIVKKREVTEDQIIKFVAKNVAPDKNCDWSNLLMQYQRPRQAKKLRRMLRDT